VVTARRGVSKMGCLIVILIIAACAYFGLDVGDAYWKYYQYKDAMNQELRYRGDKPDDTIKAHMRLVADSLELPPEAGNVVVTRDKRTKTVEMESQYDITVHVPGYERVIHFTPHAADDY
jgi:hypothetical protein